MLLGIALLATSCTYRPYSNRTPYGSGRQYGQYNHNRYDRDRHDYDRHDRDRW